MHRKWRQREHCDIIREMSIRFSYPGIRWHDLRSSFTMMLFMLGVTSIEIRDLLGHESLDSTEKYLRKLGSHLKDATDCLTFFGAKSPQLLSDRRKKRGFFVDAEPIQAEGYMNGTNINKEL